MEGSSGEGRAGRGGGGGGVVRGWGMVGRGEGRVDDDGAVCPPRGTLPLGGAGFSPSDQPRDENPPAGQLTVWSGGFAPAVDVVPPG